MHTEAGLRAEQQPGGSQPAGAMSQADATEAAYRAMKASKTARA
jgi:hypothetical protein